MAFFKPTNQYLQTWRPTIIAPPHRNNGSNNSHKSQLSNGKSKPLIGAAAAAAAPPERRSGGSLISCSTNLHPRLPARLHADEAEDGGAHSLNHHAKSADHVELEGQKSSSVSFNGRKSGGHNVDLNLNCNERRRHGLRAIEADSESCSEEEAPVPPHSARRYTECLYREEILENMCDIDSIVNLYEERDDILVVLPATLYDDDTTFVAVLMST